MLLGFFFLGIEELAIQLEEPFSVLPLSQIVTGIGLSAEEHMLWMEKTIRRERTNGQQKPVGKYSARLFDTVPTTSQNQFVRKGTTADNDGHEGLVDELSSPKDEPTQISTAVNRPKSIVRTITRVRRRHSK